MPLLRIIRKQKNSIPYLAKRRRSKKVEVILFTTLLATITLGGLT